MFSPFIDWGRNQVLEYLMASLITDIAISRVTFGPISGCFHDAFLDNSHSISWYKVAWNKMGFGKRGTWTDFIVIIYICIYLMVHLYIHKTKILNTPNIVRKKAYYVYMLLRIVNIACYSIIRKVKQEIFKLSLSNLLNL